GDDRHPFPLRHGVDADPEILPGRAGKATADFVIEPDLFVPLQRLLQQGFQDLIALVIGDPPLGDDRYDIVREPLDNLDHRSLLQYTLNGPPLRRGPPPP